MLRFVPSSAGGWSTSPQFALVRSLLVCSTRVEADEGHETTTVLVKVFWILRGEDRPTEHQRRSD